MLKAFVAVGRARYREESREKEKKGIEKRKRERIGSLSGE